MYYRIILIHRIILNLAPLLYHTAIYCKNLKLFCIQKDKYITSVYSQKSFQNMVIYVSERFGNCVSKWSLFWPGSFHLAYAVYAYPYKYQALLRNLLKSTRKLKKLVKFVFSGQKRWFDDYGGYDASSSESTSWTPCCW